MSPRYLAAVFVDTDVTVGDDETVIVVEVRHHLISVANTRTISVQNSDLLRLNKYYDMEILYTYFSCEKFETFLETFLFIFLHAAWLSPNGPGN